MIIRLESTCLRDGGPVLLVVFAEYKSNYHHRRDYERVRRGQAHGRKLHLPGVKLKIVKLMNPIIKNFKSIGITLYLLVIRQKPYFHNN